MTEGWGHSEIRESLRPTELPATPQGASLRVKPPPIESLEDVVSIQDMGLILHMKPATLRKYMRGYEGKPALPYVRIARVPHFSKRQVAWWLDQVQNMPDALMVDVRRAQKGK